MTQFVVKVSKNQLQDEKTRVHNSKLEFPTLLQWFALLVRENSSFGLKTRVSHHKLELAVSLASLVSLD